MSGSFDIAAGVGPPSRPDLVLAVYGAYQPGELAFRTIEPHVSRRYPAKVLDHVLVIDDGLPFAEESRGGSMEVHVLDVDTLGYGIVSAFEPGDLYRWSTCTAETRDGRQVAVNILVSRRSLSGHADYPHEPWSSAQDPLLSAGLIAVRELVIDACAAAIGVVVEGPTQDTGYWVPVLKLEAAYLLLWSVLERYSTLRFGAAANPERRITLLGQSEDFKQCAVAAGMPPGLTVRDTRNGKPTGATTADGVNAYKYLRQVRHNMTHRGKAAYREACLAAEAVLYAYNTTALLLQRTLPPGPHPSPAAPPLSRTDLGSLLQRSHR